MSLNVEAMTELIAALRSGEYPQARGVLRTKDGFCCLGVACEVAVKHGVIGPAVSGGTVYDETRYYYGDGVASTLPIEVAEWFGFHVQRHGEDYPQLSPVFCGFHFALENDQGAPFSVIADKFEAMLESDQAASLPEPHSRKGD